MDNRIYTYLVFFGAFIGMVLVHEIGHFLAARLCKIGVKEFGFGLPPRIVTLFRRGGTDFTLNLLPLGGFVLLKGENEPDETDGLYTAKPIKRLIVMLAGVTMNLLVAVILMTVLVYLNGRFTDTVKIDQVLPGSPAEQVGLQAGDLVRALDDTAIAGTTQLQQYIRAHLDQPVVFHIERDGQALEIPVTPLSSRVASGQGAVGFNMTLLTEPYPSWFAALPDAVYQTGAMVYDLFTLPAELLRGNIAPEEARMIGLKGIIDITSLAVNTDLKNAATEGAAPSYLTLQLIVTLNISIAVFNLLPFPALDGARVLFTLPELLLRRRIPVRIESTVHAIGMVLLLALMLYVNVMDFVNPLQLPTP